MTSKLKWHDCPKCLKNMVLGNICLNPKCHYVDHDADDVVASSKAFLNYTGKPHIWPELE